ncbi:conserved hypothetical protein [Ricinus communis]|uniref:Uncharacterized protein n=1 Tax=Ricinus communis TaxID=3988 RepID=B9RAD5_RICCO|nr:conserved hypothetical protein [Ricinus communis]
MEEKSCYSLDSQHQLARTKKYTVGLRTTVVGHANKREMTSASIDYCHPFD